MSSIRRTKRKILVKKNEQRSMDLWDDIKMINFMSLQFQKEKKLLLEKKKYLKISWLTTSQI